MTLLWMAEIRVDSRDSCGLRLTRVPEWWRMLVLVLRIGDLPVSRAANTTRLYGERTLVRDIHPTTPFHGHSQPAPCFTVRELAAEGGGYGCGQGGFAQVAGQEAG